MENVLEADRPAHAPEILTPDQAASYLKVSVAWLNKARLDGDGPAFFKLGDSPNSKVRYRKSAIESWCELRELSR